MKRQDESDREIIPGVINGSLRAPSSKSITHRLLLIGALSPKPFEFVNPLICQDTLLTIEALKKAGFPVRYSDHHITIDEREKTREAPVQIFVGNSGTTARFITALTAVLPGEFLIDGSQRMRQRPMRPLIEALCRCGAKIEHRNFCLPLRIKGSDLTGGRLASHHHPLTKDIQIDTSQSSQFVSALLLIAPHLQKGITLIPRGQIVSGGYIDLTIALLRQFGITVTKTQDALTVQGHQNYRRQTISVEGDYSGASYFMVGAVISGGIISLSGLPQNSIQGDRIITDLLKTAGANVQIGTDSVTVSGGTIESIDVDLRDFPDLAPPLTILTLFARATSRLRQMAHLRFKESDRLTVLLNNVSRLRGTAYLSGSDLIIEPTPLQGAFIPTHQDHRIAMSFALAGLRVPGVNIENPQCVKKSYPDFWGDLEKVLKPI